MGLVVVAFLFRHDHGLFIGLAVLVAVGLAPGETPGLAARVGVFAILVLLLLTPWLVLVQRSTGITEYVRTGIEYSRVEATLSRLAWPTFHIDPSEGLWIPRVDVPEPALIHIRWVRTLSPAEREQHERALGLEPFEYHEGTTWRYQVDRDSDLALALSQDPAVENTQGLERIRLRWGERISGHCQVEALAGRVER